MLGYKFILFVQLMAIMVTIGINCLIYRLLRGTKDGYYVGGI